MGKALLVFGHYADYPRNWSSMVPLLPNFVDSREFTVLSSFPPQKTSDLYKYKHLEGATRLYKVPQSECQLAIGHVSFYLLI